MPDIAEQNLPPGDIKFFVSGHIKSHTDCTAKQEQHQSEKVFAFAGQEVLNVPQIGEILFTKFTFLFTMLILQAERYQSRFAKLILKDMKNKRNVLYSLATMLVEVSYSPIQAQQKNGAHRVTFSGKWESKESIAMGGNIVCCYNSGDLCW